MTWKEFKKQVERGGVEDDDAIWMIDVMLTRHRLSKFGRVKLELKHSPHDRTHRCEVKGSCPGWMIRSE